MNRIQSVVNLMQEKSAKKLAIFSTLMTLVVIVVVCFAVVFMNGREKLQQMDECIQMYPSLMEAREKERESRTIVIREDALARGNLGMEIYLAASGMPEEERLEEVCRMVLADHVSVTDAAGTVLETTGTGLPKESFAQQLSLLEPGESSCYVDEIPSEDGKEIKTGKVFVMLAVKGESDRRLVFEFTSNPLREVYSALGEGGDFLEHLIGSLDVYALVKDENGEIAGYPLDDFQEAELSEVESEVASIFNKGGQFRKLGNGSFWKLITFRKAYALAVLMRDTKTDSTALLIMPFYKFIRTSVYCALAISLFIALSLFLFLHYVLKHIVHRGWKDEEEILRRDIGRITRPGRMVLLFSITCFFVMMLMLENRATIAFNGSGGRETLEFEADWYEHQKTIITNAYSEIYETRTKALATMLTKYKELRTRETLQIFNRMLKADYLMLFGADGNELMASNSYTGFTVNGSNPTVNERFRAVFYGYPSVIVGPEKDPYTNRLQMGVAVLLTKEDGQSDGFVLAQFNADSLNRELKQTTIENTTNKFAVSDRQTAAVVNKADGIFLAHTDPYMIGQKASSYLDEETYSGKYESFTLYDGKEVYVSANSVGDKTVMFMVPNRVGNEMRVTAGVTIVILLAVLWFLFCPVACRFCLDSVQELRGRLNKETWELYNDKYPIGIFVDGYVVFFALMAVVTMFAARAEKWPAFMFVFDGTWSKGVHIFSIWSALFFASVTLTVSFLVREILAGAGGRVPLENRTILKLTENFVGYCAGLVLILGVMYLFGVNTTALLASAGIVSIAVGMGSKNLVTDVLAGLFLAVDGSFHMGDRVSIGSWKGRVKEMGVRTTKLIDDSNNVIILNNSRINDILNMSGEKVDGMLEVPISYEDMKLQDVEEMLGKVVQAATKKMPELYGSLMLMGVYKITHTGCTARFSYTCARMESETVSKQLQEFMEQKIREELESEDEPKKE
ncbi:MAG: mechanosensitive ion channel [Clostridia bacterium]|nr:mechanosensitive ion channel [Clostridia bacterium]